MSQTLSKTDGLNVLVVDDEEVLCQSVEKILKRKGHKVDMATTVADALKRLDAGSHYDLIIADLMMPQGVDMASRQVHNGISMRIVRQYDINNDRMPCRIDVLYGYSTIRPQMACRMWG